MRAPLRRAWLRAMATACFCGLPDAISLRMLCEMTAREEPLRRGISISFQVLACIHCGKKARIPRNRWATFKFCSRKCLFAWHSKNAKTEKSCKICGHSFMVPVWRAYNAKYCSRKCYYKAMAKAGSVKLACRVCGKTFNRPPSRIKDGTINVCSIKCRGLLMRCEKPGSASYIRMWMKRRGKLMQCIRCGFCSNPKILIIHHKDRNHKNSSQENLEVLCPNCHAIEHYG